MKPQDTKPDHVCDLGCGRHFTSKYALKVHKDFCNARPYASHATSIRSTNKRHYVNGRQV